MPLAPVRARRSRRPPASRPLGVRTHPVSRTWFGQSLSRYSPPIRSHAPPGTWSLLGNPRAWTRRDAEGRVGSTGDLAQPEESGIQGEGTLEVGDADADVSERSEERRVGRGRKQRGG